MNLGPGELVRRSEWARSGLQLWCQFSETPQPLGQTGHSGQPDKRPLASAWVVAARICLRISPQPLRLPAPLFCCPAGDSPTSGLSLAARRPIQHPSFLQFFCRKSYVMPSFPLHSWGTTLAAACVLRGGCGDQAERRLRSCS